MTPFRYSASAPETDFCDLLRDGCLPRAVVFEDQRVDELTGVFIGGVHGRAARTVLGGRGLTEGGIQHAGDILRHDGRNQGGRVVLDGRALVLCIARELQRQNTGRGGDL